VATQHGNYLAKCFNGMKRCQHKPEGQLRFRDTKGHRFKPFRYMQLETLDKINQVAGFQLGSARRFSWSTIASPGNLDEKLNYDQTNPASYAIELRLDCGVICMGMKISFSAKAVSDYKFRL
ncbi:hypothetical protein Tco_0728273, partial [Tanacetum coccineum]